MRNEESAKLPSNFAQPSYSKIQSPAGTPIERQEVWGTCNIIHDIWIFAVRYVVEPASQRPKLATKAKAPFEVKIQLKIRRKPRRI
jgi:hypothetical protein